MAKANLRLNVRKLYQADGYAVQELHKVAAFLFQANVVSKLVRTRSVGRHPNGLADIGDGRRM